MKYMALFLLLLASCSTQIQKDEKIILEDLQNTSWVLINLNGRNLENFENPPTIMFSDGNRFSGKGGCNSYRGEVEISGGKIKIGNIISTKMFCEGKMDVEQEYFALLGSPKEMEIEGGKMFIYSGDDAVLEFERE